jgi:hypothetical protein
MQATREYLDQLASITDAEDPHQLTLVSEVIAALHPGHCGRVEFSAVECRHFAVRWGDTHEPSSDSGGEG